METRFKKLRRWAMAVAMSGFLLIAAAVISGAGGHLFSVLPLFLGTVALQVRPLRPSPEPVSAAPKRSVTAVGLDYLWSCTTSSLIIFVPLYAFDTFNRVLEWLQQGHLLHWPLFVAVGVWVLKSCHQVWSEIQSMTDLEIYRSYSKEPEPSITN
ncbi:MAG: hypothetical protein JWO82_1438 [Akkermansiaceae bacterium]|nr:hypothetical protein [Akkermansiaceae bacterium]